MLEHTATPILVIVATFAITTTPARAEIPLPPAIVYGKIDASRDVVATVTRAGEPFLEVVAEFTEFDGALYYAIRIPLETDIGAPGAASAPPAAREGDVLEAITVDGEPLFVFGTPLRSGEVAERSFEAGGFVRGDSNSDGHLDVSDAVRTLVWRFAGGSEPACLDAADVDDSGDVDLTDAIYHLSFLFTHGPVPAAPYPDCGDDPTADGLTCNGFTPCNDEGDGGGAEVVAEMGRGGPGPLRRAPSLEALGMRRSPGSSLVHRIELGGAGRIDARATRDGRATTTLDHPTLAVAPDAIDVGELPRDGRIIERSLTIENISGEALELELRVLDASAATHVFVSPARLVIPADGSMAAFVELHPGARSTAVEVLSNEGTLASVEIDIEPTIDSAIAIVAGGGVSAVGVGDTISVPFEISTDVDVELLEVTVAHDHETSTLSFENLAAGETRAASVEFAKAAPPHATTGAVTIVDAIARDTNGDELAISRTHGEASIREQWLDIDGDGVASIHGDLVLARRAFENGEPTFEGPLDVDGSLELDTDDFELIARGLSGFELPDRDSLARIRNLAIEGLAPSPAVDANRPFSLAITACRRAGLTRVELWPEPGASLARVTLAPIDSTMELMTPHASALEVFVEERDDELVVLVHDPLGGDIASALRGQPLLELVTAAASEGDLEVAAITANGPIASHESRVIELETTDSCDPKCEDGPTAIRAALEHLLRDADAPVCLRRLDANGDGVVGLDDVAARVRKEFAVR